MRNKIISALLALVSLASVLGATVEPAGAARDYLLRYDVWTDYYRYDAWFEHHDNGINTVNVYRYTQDPTPVYLSHSLSIQSYDFACFQPTVGLTTNSFDIYILANAATEGFQSSVNNPCKFPHQTVDPYSCLSYHVYNRNNVFYNYNPSYRACWGNGTGWHAYGPEVTFVPQYALQGNGATGYHADYYSLL